jgi:hypothetical protein
MVASHVGWYELHWTLNMAHGVVTAVYSAIFLACRRISRSEIIPDEKVPKDSIFDEGKPVGRIYEDTSASTSADMRWT